MSVSASDGRTARERDHDAGRRRATGAHEEGHPPLQARGRVQERPRRER